MIKVGMKVWNKVYGEGIVTEVNGSIIVVKVSTVDYYVHTTRSSLHIVQEIR